MTTTTTTMTRVRTGAARHEAGTKGFTLLELLVAMAIFAILAAIAIAGILHFRQKGYENYVMSDANAVATDLESSVNSAEGQYPTTLVGTSTAGAPEAVTVTVPANVYDLNKSLSKGDHFAGYTFVPASASVPQAYYYFCIEHLSNGKTDAYAVYDTRQSGIAKHSAAGGCKDATGYTFANATP